MKILWINKPLKFEDGYLIGLNKYELGINNPENVKNSHNLTNHYFSREKVDFDEFKVSLATVSSIKIYFNSNNRLKWNNVKFINDISSFMKSKNMKSKLKVFQ